MNQTLAKFLRFQPRSSLSAFRAQAPFKRAISRVVATRQPLTPNVLPLWSPFSRRCFSTEESVDAAPRGKRPTSTPSRTLFIGNIPFTCGASDLREMFKPFGQIAEIRLTRDREYPDRHRGSAHLEFYEVEDAIAALESGLEEPFFLVNRTLALDYAREGKKRIPQSDDTLFFRDFQGDVNDLREVLKNYMRYVNQINFMSQQGREESLGRGHIQFRQDSVGIVKEVLEKLHGTTTSKGFKLHLEYARKRSYYPKHDEFQRESE